MSPPDKNLVLSVNSGSSSLKISLYAVSSRQNQYPDHSSSEAVTLILTSSISSISAPPAKFSFQPIESSDDQRCKDEIVNSITDHASAFSHFLEVLRSKASIHGKQIMYICHRVVHGGDYTEPVEITQEAYHHIEKLSDLAPLHNGAALSVIKACIDVLPDAKSIAYFDTAFHRSIPIHISSYAIDPELAKKRGLKKYGFHGLSYAFILRTVSKYLSKPTEELNLIVLHLGSGASACVIKNGKSLDTSMGLTPLNGLPGATRSGSIDPSLIFHYTNKAGRITHDPNMAIHIGVTKAEDILNRKSGWKAITGTTDFGVITSKADLENHDPDVSLRNPYRLAYDIFLDRILHFVGSYHLKLGGEVDAIVFAGGIGEKSVQLRSMVGERLQCLGYPQIDAERNESVGKVDEVVVEISVDKGQTSNRQKHILVCHTDEQLEMARECALDPRFWDES
ncbi:putative acetate kinase [Psilocybe cubensis]|uniref:Acetate kinase n=2 Tax=Psilocybe cubensis TaxID=181762 RepID=A0ACB8H0I7_PSICU|nr:putative acetate kinase [Psilocybe cubensis]KAH9481510.1 putative acetate kinase [Psilocybe cubensis]